VGHDVGSLERATHLLQLVAAEAEGARLCDLARLARLPASTTHRLLSGLEELGLARRRPSDKRYRTGERFLTLCGAARRQWSVDEIARPVLGLLSRRCGATSYLSIVSGLDAACVLRVEGGSALRAVTLQEGTLRPLGIGAGSLALLAVLGDREVQRIVEANALPPGEGGAPAEFGYDPERVMEDVRATRAQGYACHSGRLVRGVDGLGVASRLAGVDVGISISFIGDLTSLEQRADHLALLREAADGLTAASG
jgi:DNA-binding IclR family transcriptional regulator